MTGLVVTTTTTIVVGLLLGLAVRRWVLAPARVESSSMEPTLRPGQRLVIRRHRGPDVTRGDLVLVRSAELGRVVVKRVIGLPGERVHIDARGRVHIDGRGLEEPYARHAPGPASSWSVPGGSLFLLGDNRTVSSDSRRWRRPFLPLDAVVGRVVRGGEGG